MGGHERQILPLKNTSKRRGLAHFPPSPTLPAQLNEENKEDGKVGRHGCSELGFATDGFDASTGQTKSEFRDVCQKKLIQLSGERKPPLECVFTFLFTAREAHGISIELLLYISSQSTKQSVILLNNSFKRGLCFPLTDLLFLSAGVKFALIQTLLVSAGSSNYYNSSGELLNKNILPVWDVLLQYVLLQLAFPRT